MNNKGKTLHALILKFRERKAYKKYLTQLIFTSHITLAFTTLILKAGYIKLESQTSMLVFYFNINIYYEIDMELYSMNIIPRPSWDILKVLFLLFSQDITTKTNPRITNIFNTV